MSTDAIQGIVRAVLAAVGGFIVGKGWIDADTWTQVGGAALTILTAIWSVLHNNAQAKAAGK